MKNEEIIIERFNIDNYAEYVINIAYPNSKISLKADGDKAVICVAHIFSWL